MRSFIKKIVVGRQKPYGLHRCGKKGCGQFFRTMSERIIHEGQGEHCKFCGFGLTDVTPNTGRAVFCLACEVDMAGNYPRKRSEVN